MILTSVIAIYGLCHTDLFQITAAFVRGLIVIFYLFFGKPIAYLWKL
ncbi:hypothetical protein JOC85_000981 [Bacillus mesophilus]|nr:hypothetical protein [Bacillus mesophilus]